LAIGEAFLRITGMPVARIRIEPPQDVPVIAPAFVPRTMPVMPEAAIVPAPSASTRFEDRDDWLTAGDR